MGKFMGMSRRAVIRPAAAASVALVLGGLSAAPPESANQLAVRATAATVQVESIVLTAFDAAVAAPAADIASVTSAVTEPVSAAAATGASDLLRTTLGVGIGLAVAPLWYVTLPVTLPLSIGAVTYFSYAMMKIFAPTMTDFAALLGALAMGIPVGAVGWVAGPVLVGLSLAGLLMPAATEPVPLVEPAAALPTAAVAGPTAARAARVATPEPSTVRAQRMSRSESAAADVPAGAAASVARAAAAEKPADTTSTDDRAQPAPPESASRKGSATNRDDPRAAVRAADNAGRR